MRHDADACGIHAAEARALLPGFVSLAAGSPQAEVEEKLGQPRIKNPDSSTWWYVSDFSNNGGWSLQVKFDGTNRLSDKRIAYVFD